jgi:ankyrin repeat protein
VIVKYLLQTGSEGLSASLKKSNWPIFLSRRISEPVEKSVPIYDSSTQSPGGSSPIQDQDDRLPQTYQRPDMKGLAYVEELWADFNDESQASDLLVRNQIGHSIRQIWNDMIINPATGVAEDVALLLPVTFSSFIVYYDKEDDQSLVLDKEGTLRCLLQLIIGLPVSFPQQRFYLPNKQDISAIANSLHLLPREIYMKAVMLILSSLRKAALHNIQSILLNPHTLSSLALAALQSKPGSGRGLDIGSLLYFCIPESFGEYKDNLGCIESIFKVTSAASIARFTASTKGASLLICPFAKNLFTSLLSTNLTQFCTHILSPIVDAFSRYAEMGLFNEHDSSLLREFWKGNVERFSISELRHTASFINLGIEIGLRDDVQVAMSRYSRIDRVDHFGQSLMHVAADMGLDGTIQYLLDIGYGGLVNIPDVTGRTPLHETARRGLEEATVKLLTYGAQPDIADDKGRTPLHEAVKAVPPIGAGEPGNNLLQWELKSNMYFNPLKYRLQAMAEGRSLIVVQRILGAGANVNARDNNGRSPLHVAIEHQPLGIKANFMKTEAQMGINYWQHQPLAKDKARSDHIEIIRTLISAGAQPDLPDVRGRTALHEAVSSRSLITAKMLITLRVNVNSCDVSGQTALYESIHQHDATFLEYLLDAGADVNIRNLDGETPLHQVARCSRASNAFEALLDVGVDVNARDYHGRTPLHEACPNNPSTDILQILLAAGADFKALDNQLRTPLHKAAKGSSISAVRAILDAGAEVNVRDEDGRTPLHEVIKGSGSMLVINALLDAGADVAMSDNEDRTPLYEAAKKSNMVAVKRLLEAGADIHVRTGAGRTCLHEVVAGDFTVDMIKLFLAAGAQVNAHDNDGRTPLHEAVVSPYRFGKLEVLLAFEAEVNVQDKDGRAPLHEAIKSSNSAYVSRLLAAGADRNVSDKDGRTALHEAVRAGSPSIIKDLITVRVDEKIEAADKKRWAVLHAGVKIGGSGTRREQVAAKLEVDPKDNDGRTPIFEANVVDIVSALISAGASVNITDKRNRSPLHEAAKTKPDIVRMLLQAGAQVNVLDNDGQSPLHEAAKSHPSIVKALLAAGAEINVQDKDGRSPLYNAVEHSSHSTSCLIVDLTKQQLLTTHIHEDTEGFLPSVVQTLLEHGAKTEVHTVQKTTLFHLVAQGYSVGDLVLLLQRSDVKPDERDFKGDTALHLAMAIGSHEVGRRLAPRYSSYLTENNEGSTPLDEAARRSGIALYRLLQEATLCQVAKPRAL